MQQHCTCMTSLCLPSQPDHKSFLYSIAATRDAGYMQWLSARMAACLQLVVRIPQTARSCTYSISMEKDLSSHQCKHLWYVLLPCPARPLSWSQQLSQAAESLGAMFYIAIDVFHATCQGHRDWLFGVTWLTDRHIVTGEACCVYAP